MKINNNPLFIPLRTRGLRKPDLSLYINKKVKMNPETVKNTGAVIPRK